MPRGWLKDVKMPNGMIVDCTVEEFDRAWARIHRHNEWQRNRNSGMCQEYQEGEIAARRIRAMKEGD